LLDEGQEYHWLIWPDEMDSGAGEALH
jgi:hypothetical protein